MILPVHNFGDTHRTTDNVEYWHLKLNNVFFFIINLRGIFPFSRDLGPYSRAKLKHRLMTDHLIII